ncbi:MAG: hypothetical protein ABW019_13000 [Chitinophagaceae bacterium]
MANPVNNTKSASGPAVPVQRKGAGSDTRYSVRLPDGQAAQQLFEKARLNLLNVNSWRALAGSGAVFRIVNESGEEVNGLVQQGHYLRISIPAIPGNKAGQGSEWVQVEKIEEGKIKYHEFIAIRVRPASPPFAPGAETAHFFSSESTSSFCVVRNNNRITASVSGRNELPNTQTRNWLTGLRNLIVAAGAMLGLNKPQWKSLVKGIIRNRKPSQEKKAS